MKCFESYHPIILFFYFASVLFITMFTMNPILVIISFVSSITFCGMLIGIKKLLKSLAYSIPVMLIIAVTNPIFVHKGTTLLFFLNDNPVTLEAVVYGAFISAMLISVYYWFKCYNEVMTSDKYIYLFGKFIPKLSLLLSMVLRFIPKFKKQFKEIDTAQKALGIYTSKSCVDKIRSKIRVISIIITWSLENSIDTADSMRARGYGLKGRTNYSIYKWTTKDTVLSVIVLSLSVIVYTLMFMDKAAFLYYPSFDAIDLSILCLVLYIGLFVLMVTCIFLEIKENMVWRLLKSGI